jgi:hypothetical protein
MAIIDQILNPYREGRPALLVTGRSFHDLVVADDQKIRPILSVLRKCLRDEHGMVFISYSMAQGLDWDEARIEDERDHHTIANALRTNHLIEIPQDQNEIVRVMRGISSLSRTPTQGIQWADGTEMRFAFCLEFGEHLTPLLSNGTQTDNQLVAIELAHLTSQSLALRSSGNLIMFHARDGLIDPLVCAALHHVHLPQPNGEEKEVFVQVACQLYPEAEFEAGLTVESVARLTANTPNRSIEALLRAAHREHKTISAKELACQKDRDVEEMSESTLSPLDTARVADLKLYGRNIEKPKSILEHLGDALLRADPTSPANILLCGAPGTAKTDLAVLVSRIGKVPAYEMRSPKGGIVGETERKARLQQTALREWSPNVAFVDEITEAFPLERSDFDGDSGASRAVTAALLTALSDETRRGRSLLIATTNCPWRMGAAMRSRFMIIPVLQPLREDYAEIIKAISGRISPDSAIDAGDRNVQKAAELFYSKAANPRHIRAALSNALMISRSSALTSEIVLFAATDFCGTTDLHSAIYSDLQAINACSSKSFLPWSDDPQGYPFPPYLEGIVNAETGDIDGKVLMDRIKEFEPHSNL